MSKFYDQSTAKYYDPSVSVDSLSADDATLQSSFSTPVKLNGQAISSAIIDPETTDPTDLFYVDDSKANDTVIWFSVAVTEVGGNQSHKFGVAKSDGRGSSHVKIIDQYRSNSFRNQLDDPTRNSTENRWEFASTGTDAGTPDRGRFRLTLWGDFEDGEAVIA